MQERRRSIAYDKQQGGDMKERNAQKIGKTIRSRPGHVREAGDGCLPAILEVLCYKRWFELF